MDDYEQEAEGAHVEWLEDERSEARLIEFNNLKEQLEEALALLTKMIKEEKEGVW